jgi:hypothetical protein
MEHYDIVIGTPGSLITGAFVRSLTKTIKVLEEEGITWQFINYESPTLRHARERVINDRNDDQFDSEVPFSGKFTYNKIMWIDSDIQWEPEDVLTLYRSERDIVTGAYMQTNGTVAISFDEVSSPYPHQIPVSRESIVTSCGFGFICIKQGVFEQLPRPWFDNFLFNKDGTVASYATEDSAWCAKARSFGFKIWFDPSVRVIHNKTMSLVWLDSEAEL